MKTILIHTCTCSNLIIVLYSRSIPIKYYNKVLQDNMPAIDSLKKAGFVSELLMSPLLTSPVRTSSVFIPCLSPNTISVWRLNRSIKIVIHRC